MAGGSAQREYERLRDTRQRRIGRSRRRIVVATLGAFAIGWFAPSLFQTVAMSMLESIATGGDFEVTITQAPWALSAFTASALALMTGVRLLAPSQRELAWAKGAAGERAVGDALDELAASTPIVTLHDRLMPGSRANIDHVVVTTSGVVTIDAKAYAGRLEVRGRGRELWIAGRNRSKLIDQAQRQRAVVVETLHRAGLDDVPVESALCFVGTQFPRFFRPERVGEVHLTTPSRLSGLLTDGEPGMTDERHQQIVEALQRALRPATGDRDQLPRASGHAAAGTEHGQEGKSESAPAETERTCGRCGAAMVVRRRRSDGAPFLGCSAFPRCRNTSDLRAG